MCNLNFLLIISAVTVQTKCVGERENGFERKRFDIGLENCMESFDVHVDKIIRTQDSRAMGAKYLNEAEVNGKDECMKLCCETPNCDVFVLEQKVPGSCYLFHCGSPEDFKCKFTQHNNYTSAVLALYNHFTEVESPKKLTKQEKELNMLRKIDISVETTTSQPLSTKVPAEPVQPKQNSTKNQCSRYQFECRGSRDCIAIYNACDGIPQCSDGSDEAPELYCPYLTGTPHPKTFHEQLKNLKGSPPQPEKAPEVPASTETLRILQQPLTKSSSAPRQHPSASGVGHFPYGYSQQNEPAAAASHPKLDPPQQVPNQPRYYGREGEMVQYPMGGMQWQGYQSQAQDEGNHKFNRKGNVLVPDASDSGQYPAPYSNELNHAEYLKYAAAAANSGFYSGPGPVYYPSPKWPPRLPQQMHEVEDVPQRPLLSMYGNGMSGSAPSDYYYDDSQLKGRFPAPPQEPQAQQNSDNQQPSPVKPKQETYQESPKVEEPKKNESVKKTLENVNSTSIKTSPEVGSTTAASVKNEKPFHWVAEKIKFSDGEVDGVNERPIGAILSLTLGMCITAIMITLVGCRLRVVRRRMRRNGKSYAHDADYLVNGMYL